MKNQIYLLVISLLMLSISCKEQSKSEQTSVNETTTPTEKRVAELLSDPVLSNEWEKEIQLDGKSKWLANKETTQGVNNMLNILENTTVGPEMNFKALGTKLKSEINVVIQKCSMKGSSHDNLHVFLMPLIEKVDALQEVNDIEKSKALVASIFYHLEVYTTYFE